nr:uncharacterized protein LOC127313190 [Lolium perenne]
MAENSKGVTLMTPLCNCHCRECTLPKLKAKERTSSNGAAYSSSSCPKSAPSLLKMKPEDCRELAIGLSMCQSTDKDLMAHGCTSSPDPVYEKIPCGSRYWELNKPPEHVKGINPLAFFSPHPVWEGFAAPVEREGKTDSFYCVSCNKVLSGRADSAVKHMVVRNGCRITPESKQDLLRRIEAFNKRRNDLKRK